MLKFTFILIAFSSTAFSQSLSEKNTLLFNFITSSSFKQKTFKFYISSIKLNLSDGSIQEENTCHLIDQERIESQTIRLNKVHSTDIKSIEFLIGTDSIVNVSGILDGDLDPIKGMYWAWNSGYVNCKLEGDFTKGTVTYPIELHLGGYSGSQATAQRVILPVNSTRNDSLTIDVDPVLLVEQLNLKSQNKVLTPGVKAVEISKLLPTIFSLRD